MDGDPEIRARECGTRGESFAPKKKNGFVENACKSRVIRNQLVLICGYPNYEVLRGPVGYRDNVRLMTGLFSCIPV